MAFDLFEVAIEGNVGGKIELKHNNEGAAWMSLSVACDVKRGAKKEKKIMWIRVLVFGKYAEILYQQVQKGTSLRAEGEYDDSIWFGGNDKPSGINRTVIARRIKLFGNFKYIDGKKDQHSGSSQAMGEEDLPF